MAIGDRLVLTRTITKMSGSQFAQYGTKVERKLQQTVFQVGQRARDMARRAAPVDTGALRSSIYVTKGAVDRDATGLMSHKPGNAFTKQSSLGYFRALNAAMAKNKRIKTFPMMSEYGVSDARTNRIMPGNADRLDVGTTNPMFHFRSDKSQVNEFLTHTYKTFGSGVEDALLPMAMEMGNASRSNLFVTIGASAYYAGYVEFGHVVPGGATIPAKPFLGPAAFWAFDEVKVQIARTLNENGITA